jgi:hypothetical protein
MWEQFPRLDFAASLAEARLGGAVVEFVPLLIVLIRRPHEFQIVRAFPLAFTKLESEKESLP